jgi:hypothetical protein
MTDESPALLSRLLQLSSRLEEQALEMAIMRTELDIQFKRIAALQAELDVLPAVQRRREGRRSTTVNLGTHSGNGR